MKKRKEELIKAFGLRIKKVREYLGMKQKDFAESIGMASSSISEVECGKTSPGFEFFYKLSKKYKINPTYLLHGEGAMFLPEAEEADNKAGPGKKDYGDSNRKIHELLWYMERSDMLKYSILESFSRYLLKNEEDIRKEIGSLYEEEDKNP